MIYNEKYKVKFYCDSRTGKWPVLSYLKSLDNKKKQKINKYIELLKENDGYLDYPYSRHIKGKIRELRVDFNNSHHRIFYFSFINKNIILLHAFTKKTQKTPKRELRIAEKNYQDVISNYKIYE